MRASMGKCSRELRALRDAAAVGAWCVRPLLVAAALTMVSAGAAPARLAVLHSFTGGADGGQPYYGAPVVAGSTVYGTTGYGGFGGGVVFAVGIDGSDYTVLHRFTNAVPDGWKPFGSVALAGETLYGTTYAGGSGDGNNGNGTVFAVNIDGTGYRTLHSFTTDAGYKPYSTVTLLGTNLYGTTYYSRAGFGSIYKVGMAGGGYDVLHDFAGGTGDGSRPLGAVLTVGGNTLYGTTVHGGPGSTNTATDGIAFSIGGEGGNYARLANLTGGAEGANPYGSLTPAGPALYGTTRLGGQANLGTIFRMNADGSDYQTLYTFTGGTNSGANPYCTLTLDGTVLYGTTRAGGAANLGTVFKINLDGSDFEILHSFAGPDGSGPSGDLTLAANRLYGFASAGGDNDKGTVFALDVGVSGYCLEGRDLVTVVAGRAVDGGLYTKTIPTWLNVAPSLPYAYTNEFVIPACDGIVQSRLLMTVWGGTVDYTCRMMVTVNGTVLPTANPFTFGTAAHSNSLYNAAAPRAYGSGYGVWLVAVPIEPERLHVDGSTNTIAITVATPDGFDGRIQHVTLVAVYRSASRFNLFDYAIAEGEGLVYGSPLPQQVDQRAATLDVRDTNEVFEATLTVLYTYGNSGQNDALFFNGASLGGNDVAQWDARVTNYGPSVVSFDVRDCLLARNAMTFDVSAENVSGTRETSLRAELAILGVAHEAPLECRDVVAADAGGVAFRWPGYAPHSYRVEWSTNLLNPAGWAPLSGYMDIAGTNGMMRCYDAADGVGRFYRVAINGMAP